MTHKLSKRWADLCVMTARLVFLWPIAKEKIVNNNNDKRRRSCE
jgi:hypothetical protein